MSNFERNKGKLIPRPDKAFPRNGYEWDRFWDEGFVIVKGVVYEAVFEEEGDENLVFAEVFTNEVGEIDFHTLHYNGGGHWIDAVEGEL